MGPRLISLGKAVWKAVVWRLRPNEAPGALLLTLPMRLSRPSLSLGSSVPGGARDKGSPSWAPSCQATTGPGSPAPQRAPCWGCPGLQKAAGTAGWHGVGMVSPWPGRLVAGAEWDFRDPALTCPLQGPCQEASLVQGPGTLQDRGIFFFLCVCVCVFLGLYPCIWKFPG